jgi:glyoxylase-like metal-dependent hydrolase (beta-lactamase superfamily II)
MGQTASMHRWLIGDVEIIRIEDLDFAVPSEAPVPDWCVPDFAPSNREFRIAFSVLAIASDGVNIVVDPWLANDGPRDQPDASAHAARLLGELAAAGFPADEVDLVVNSHLDGVGWNTVPTPKGWEPAFPNARYLYPATELAAIAAGEPINGDDALAELAAQRDLEAVEAPLALTSTVSLSPAPGHNFGHVAVRIDDGNDLAIYAGHLVLTPFQVDDPESGDDANPTRDTAVASRRKILDELAARNGLLLTTLLGGPGGGRVRRHDNGFAIAAD